MFKRYYVATIMLADISAFEDSGLLSLTQAPRHPVEGLESMFNCALRGEYRRFRVSKELAAKSIRDEII